MEPIIWHIALVGDWNAAQQTGTYAVSTRGRSVSEVGYLHGSFDADQVGRVAAAFYADAGPLVLLGISTTALAGAGIEVRAEPGDPRDPGSELFPHAYGAVPVSAVVRTIPATVHDGVLVAPGWEHA
ncbi:DUF952 domain-containing protein [Antribacter gilvus]|uniref:DUF952 domain-containing protein n=1 Tax=Antribacter gilvus TaxID=2304675 RepID=UPI00197FD347|nr:DUF952 domain-containing protein [Antribacter gilvus]